MSKFNLFLIFLIFGIIFMATDCEARRKRQRDRYNDDDEQPEEYRGRGSRKQNDPWGCISGPDVKGGPNCWIG